MLKFLKRKILGSDSEKAADNLAKAASVSSVDRRAHVRITYPQNLDLEALPNIQFQGKNVLPINVSLGGMLVDLTKVNGLVVGTEHEFHFTWKENPEGVFQKARLLRISGRHFHFKFIDLATDLIVRCSLVFKPGERGKKTHKLAPFDMPKDRKDVREMWTNGYGDYVAVTSSKSQPLEIQYANRRYIVCVDKSWILKHLDNGTLKGVTKFVYEDILLFLSNLNSPSPSIHKAMEVLAQISKSA